MENEQGFLTEEEANVIGKWSEYVRISLLNGTSVDEIKGRLRENKLSDEQVELLFDQKRRRGLTKKERDTKDGFFVLGLFKVLAGLFFLFETNGNGTFVLSGVLLLGTGIYWLVKGRTGEV